MSRIIAGSRGGRKLRMPAHRATRPTSDRVREAAFSLIADWAGSGGRPAAEMLSGLSFVDLYAGSGAVALEAASRGAFPVLAVESDRGTAEIARGNATDSGLAVRVQVGRVERVLASPPPHPFDVVWADPPYAMPNAELEPLIDHVLRSGWLAERGLVVLERSTRDQPVSWPECVEETWKRGYGETTLYFATKGGTC